MAKSEEGPAPPVAVIVPLAPAEPALDALLGQLEQLPDAWEVLLVARDEPARISARCSYVAAAKDGRAAALNAGVAEARAPWLWFLHADSQLDGEVVAALEAALASGRAALHYFRLRYHDGKWFHRINELGANLRSQLFGAPFGDQAFLVPRRVAEMLGGFDEQAPYGEDHLFARAARRARVPLVMLPAAIGSSARHHIEHGWLNVVARYQWLWISQALADRRDS